MLRTKNDIIDWLQKYHIDNYKLIEDEQYGFVVNVAGSVNISHLSISEISVKFNHVSNFYCHGNQLTSLLGSPNEVACDFYCNDNQIMSLDHCPKYIGGDFNCSSNKLTSLNGCISHIKNSFSCDNNELVDLESCPIFVDGYFYAQGNKLKNLIFFPENVGGKTYLRNNPELGNWQIEEDFTILQKEHLRQKSLHDLHDTLMGILPQQNQSNYKNKI